MRAQLSDSLWTVFKISLMQNKTETWEDKHVKKIRCIEAHGCLKGNCIIKKSIPQQLCPCMSFSQLSQSETLSPPVIIYYLYNHRERPCGSCKFQELSEPCTFPLVFESSEPHFFSGRKRFQFKKKQLYNNPGLTENQ